LRKSVNSREIKTSPDADPPVTRRYWPSEA
jgi:hypothetical protein